MNFKAITLGLAVASVATLSLAKPVAYQIDPTHTATVFSWNHFGFSTPSANFTTFKVQLTSIMKNLQIHLLM